MNSHCWWFPKVEYDKLRLMWGENEKKNQRNVTVQRFFNQSVAFVAAIPSDELFSSSLPLIGWGRKLRASSSSPRSQWFGGVSFPQLLQMIQAPTDTKPIWETHRMIRAVFVFARSSSIFSSASWSSHRRPVLKLAVVVGGVRLCF